MKIETAILKNVEKLPESLQIEVLHYVEYLGSRYLKEFTETTSNVSQENSPEIPEEEKPKKRGGFGILKGKIWMSDDFDEPLEDLKDYM